MDDWRVWYVRHWRGEAQRLLRQADDLDDGPTRSWKQLYHTQLVEARRQQREVKILKDWATLAREQGVEIRRLKAELKA